MQRNITISVYAFHRGTSKSNEAMAFRRWFYKLSELWSLVQGKIPFMVVTATASRQTKETITSVLRFGNFVDVSESRNKPNICYSIQTMDKRTPLLQYFQWILSELKEKKVGQKEQLYIAKPKSNVQHYKTIRSSCKKWVTQFLPMTAKILENDS